jgi:hypothetical protein
MFKNVASQKLTVFAFDASGNTPKTGDGSNLTAYVSIDDGTVTVLGDTSATEKDATNAAGLYDFDLTQAETNGNKLVFSGKSSTANVKIVPITVYTRPAHFSNMVIGSGAVLPSGSFYYSDIRVTINDSGSPPADNYIISWFKDNNVITSGVTSPTVTVTKVSDASTLINAGSLTEIGSTHAFKYAGSGAVRISNGDSYIVATTATIDGANRTWRRIISRDVDV